jgi:hypothetical protein
MEEQERPLSLLPQASRHDAALPFQHSMKTIVYVDGFNLYHAALRGGGCSCAH